MEKNENQKLILFQNRSTRQLSKFLHGVIDECFCHSKALDYANFQDLWTLEEWFEVQKVWPEFLKSIFSAGFTKESIPKEIYYLDQEIQELICECVNERSDDIHNYLMVKTSRINYTSLKDFDWQFKLVLGSDKVANVKYPLATVQFYIKRDGHNQKFDVEMSRDELKNFIASLENAQKAAVKAKS